MPQLPPLPIIAILVVMFLSSCARSSTPSGVSNPITAPAPTNIINVVPAPSTAPIPTSTLLQVDAYPAYLPPDNDVLTPIAYPYPGLTYTPANPIDEFLTHTPTTISTPNKTPTPVPLPNTSVYPLLAGLKYRTDNGEYEIDSKGTASLLPPNSSDILTPDGRFRVIIDNDEIYLEDISTRVRTNLINSPGVPSSFYGWSVDGKWMFYQEGDEQTGTTIYRLSIASRNRQQLPDLPDSNTYFISRWPNDPELLLVNIRPRSIKVDTMDLPFSGYLYLLHLNDQTLEQVSHQIGVFYPGFPPYESRQSPDRFIWSEYGNTYVFIRGQGSQPFKLAPIVNMKVDEKIGIRAPIWSPDERWLAFQAFYKERTGWVLIDLKNQTARLLHLYTHVGMGGHVDAPGFSPDSRWLIVSARADESDLNGDWLYSVEGDEKVHLPGPFVIFQQDGSHLLVKNLESLDGYYYVTVGDWEKTIEVSLPPGAYQIQGWK
jgi:hypothetical protein